LRGERQVGVFLEPGFESGHQHRRMARVVAQQRAEDALDEAIEQAAVANGAQKLQHAEFGEAAQAQALGKALGNRQRLARLTQVLRQLRRFAAGAAKPQKQAHGGQLRAQLIEQGDHRLAVALFAERLGAGQQRDAVATLVEQRQRRAEFAEAVLQAPLQQLLAVLQLALGLGVVRVVEQLLAAEQAQPRALARHLQSQAEAVAALTQDVQRRVVAVQRLLQHVRASAADLLGLDQRGADHLADLDHLLRVG